MCDWEWLLEYSSWKPSRTQISIGLRISVATWVIRVWELSVSELLETELYDMSRRDIWVSESFNKFKLFNRFQLLDRFEIFNKFELINMIKYLKNCNSLTYWESNRETTINFEYSHMTLNKSNTYSKQKKINGIVYNIIYFILTNKIGKRRQQYLNRVKFQALLLNLCSNIRYE